MQKKKEEKRTIPLKNYILLAILFVGVSCLVLYICSCYKTYSDSKREVPVIKDHLPEITNVDFEHYIEENPSIILYMCTASDNKCRNLEKNLIKLIDKEDLYYSLTYVNLSNADNAQFVDFFNNKYGYRISLKGNYPAFVAFVDGKVVDLLQSDDYISSSDVEKFIKKNNVVDTYE